MLLVHSGVAVSLDAVLRPALEQRKADQLYRTRRTLATAQQPVVVVDGQRYLNFCSNDYLGLASHPAVTAAFQHAADRFGVGSGASHLVCGHSALHHALEERLAALTGRPRALLFSTGYMANLAVATALLGRRDFVFEDRLNHASLLDGGLLSGARFQRFAHNDCENLRERLAGVDEGRKLICVDGVFSMDGDLAPLPTLATLAREHDAWLMADDAHGFGVLGRNGAGTAEHYGLSLDELPILMGTLGKSVGCFGAFVAGSETLIETLIQFGRTYIYTTALPPAVAGAALAALDLIEHESWRRERLAALVTRFRQGAEQLGLPLLPSTTAIQPLLVGDAGRALAVSERLAAAGCWVSAIRPPTVPAHTARLRITLTAAHEEMQVDQLLAALERAWR